MHGRACSGGTAKAISTQQLVWYKKGWAASASHAEARAMLLALEIAKDQGWSKILLLSDCQILCDAVNGITDSPWEASFVVDDI